ncbi:hypothetical protein DF185_11180 [Marinifilum breve]|uniref:Acyltransferase 3 domain-containing protein n=1 Tax=Marinifilum breve TaxID=2184082 RepID=A0A2V4A1L3_9BACT|nr:acyltransferase family protein [Marinifilum breve]PXY01200.1 hypothetical protein DF185_11180 [Marinifilum breve]
MMKVLFPSMPEFSKEIVNTGRQLEMDIARGLAVFFMVLVHVQMSFSKEDIVESGFGGLIDFLGGVPAAPVFMFLMGLGFLYTKNDNPGIFFKRGLYILLAGYVLNFFRESLPELIDYFTLGTKESLEAAIEGFIDVDILQFAGLAMIFFALYTWMSLKWYMVLYFALIFASMNYSLQSIQTEDYLWSAITGLFWGSSEYSEFPFLSWIFYPITGYVFAQLLIRCTDKKTFYKWLFLVSLLATVAGVLFFAGVLGMGLGMETELAYYHHDFAANLVFLLFVLTWISMLFLLMRILPEFVVNQFKRWSKNVTEIYFIHWVLIGWLQWYVYPETYDIVVFVILSVIIFLVADGFSHLLAKRQIKLI